MSRGGGARPLLDLARGHLLCSKRVGWEGVTEPRSLGARPVGWELPLDSWEGLGVILEAPSKLCLGGEAAPHWGGGREEASGGRAREGRH